MGKQSNQPRQQTVTQRVELPAWVSQAGQDNYTDAKNVAANLLPPDLSNKIAPFTDEQGDAWRLAHTATDAASGANGAGQGALTAAANYTPIQVIAQQIAAQQIADRQKMIAAQQIAGTNVSAKTFSADALKPYLNPYTEDVVNAELSDLDRARQASLVQTGDQAAAAGAFGGSRQAIREGVTDAESARASGQLSAALRDQAFNTAAGLLNTDNDRVLTADRANQATDLAAKQSNQSADLSAQQANQSTWLNATHADQLADLAAKQSNQSSDLSAQQSNQGAGLTANAQKIAAGSALAGLGQQQFAQTLQQASVNEGIGAQLRALNQAYLDQGADNYNRLRNYPVEQLNLKLAALAHTPYGQTTSTTGPATQQGGSPLLGLLGGAAQGASIASTLGLTTALGTGVGGGLGAGLGGLVGLLAMSDRNEKTDIRRVGEDPKTGLLLYAYRYKGDPKTYQKVVGPMAQDIERKYPGAVAKVPGTGKRAVNANFLGGVMAPPGADMMEAFSTHPGRHATAPAMVPPPHPHPAGRFLSGGVEPARHRRATQASYSEDGTRGVALRRPTTFLGGYV